MSLQLITPPALEPVTLDEAKAHLKVDTADDDALIATLIAAARTRAEWHCGRAFITQAWILWLDCWPGDGEIEIPLPPLQAVSAITTYARDGSPGTLDPLTYTVDAASQPGRVVLACAAVPPLANLRRINAIAVAFSAGYGTTESSVPAPIREAILEIVAELYANRGDAAATPSPAALALLAPYRMLKL